MADTKNDINMDSNKKKVMEYVQLNFDLTFFKIIHMDILPGGVILEGMKGGAILIYHDFIHGKIVWKDLSERR